MNKIYKVIYCKATQTFVAVSEFAKGQGKGSVRGQRRRVSRAGGALIGRMKLLSLSVLIGLGSMDIAMAGETPLYANDGSDNGCAVINDSGIASGVNSGTGCVAYQVTDAADIANTDRVVVYPDAAGNANIAIGGTAFIGTGLDIKDGATIDMGNNRVQNVDTPTADTDAANKKYVDDNVAHYYSVNDGGTAGANYNNDGATGTNALAAGVGTKASGEQSTAIGNGATATGGTGIVPSGNNAGAQRGQNTAVGYSATTAGNWSTAVGANATTKPSGTAIGANTSTTGAQAVAIGGANNVALKAATAGEKGVAIGVAAEATPTNGNQGVAVGNFATATGDQSTALGANAIASGASSITIGGDDLDTASNTNWEDGSIATTGGDQVTNWNNTGTITVNAGSVNTRFKALTGMDLVDANNGYDGLYPEAEASGASAIAVGTQAIASGHVSTAFGTKTEASGLASLALGTVAQATKDNSVALGSGSTTATDATRVTEATVGSITYGGFAGAGTGTGAGLDKIDTGDQVSVGAVGYERQIKNVAPGEISATSTDAINGSQLYSVADKIVTTGFNITADDTSALTSPATSDNVALGETVDFTSGSGNIKTAVSDNKIDFEFADSITIGKASSANSNTAAANPITINSTAGTITGLADTLPDTTNTTTSQAAAPTTTIADGTAATVDDVLNAGWNLQGDSTAVDFVKAYDTVNFVDGQGTDAKVSVNSGVNEITFDVKTDGTTTKIDGGNVVVATGGFTNNTDGTVAGDTTDGTIATVGDVASAINNSGFTAGNANSDTLVTENTGSTVINPGDSLTVDAGKNLSSAFDASTGTLQISTKDDVNFNSVESDSIVIGDSTGDSTTLSSTADGLSVGGDKITNVAAGDISATSTDAVNGSQLFNQVAASKEEVKSDDKSVTVTTTQNADGANVFDLSVNTDGTTITTDPTTGEVKAVTSDITSNTNGTVTAATPSSLATAGDVADAINSSGWNLQEDGTAVDLVNPSNTVNFVSGDGVDVSSSTDNATSEITFAVKTDGTTTKIDTNGNVVAATGGFTNNTNGTVSGDTTSGGTIATVGDVASAINNSGFKLDITGNIGTDVTTGNAGYELISPSNTVTIDGGDNITVSQENGKITIASDSQNIAEDAQLPVVYTDADGNKVYKQVDPVTGNVTFTTNPDGTGTTVANGDVIASMQNADGSTTTPTTLANVASTLPSTYNVDALNTSNQPVTTAQSLPSTLTTSQLNNAATVGDVLNSGWNLQTGGSAVDFVKAYDSVNFKAGDGLTVSSDTNGTTSNITYALNYDTNVFEMNNGKLTLKDSTLAVTNTGTSVSPTNGSTTTTGGGAGGNLTLEAGNNLNASLDATNNTIQLSTADDVTFDNVTVNDGLTVNNGATVDMGGNTITNVAAGVNDTDAVNVSQLNNAISQNYQVVGGTNTNGNAVDADGNTLTDSNGNPITASIALKTYSPDGQGEKINNTIISAIKNMNEGGIKYFHTNDTGNNYATSQNNTEDSQAGGAFSTAIGYQAVSGGESSLAIGNGSQATGDQSIAVGTGNVVEASNSGAFGDPNIINGTSVAGTAVSGSYAIGNDNIINTSNTFVLGNNVNNDGSGNAVGSTVANSVYLGNEASSTGAHTTANYGTNGNYTYAGANDANVSGINDVVGVVTVGTNGQTRQIQNVSAGVVSADSTDAINGSQLYWTNQAVATNATNIANNAANIRTNAGNIRTNAGNIQTNAGNIATNAGNISTNAGNIAANATEIAKGLNFTDDAGNTVNRQLGDAVKVSGDKNITTKTTDDGVQVTLNPDVTADSLTTGNTVVNNDGVTVGGGENDDVRLTNSGLDNGGNTITNVAPGVYDNDAVNVYQLKALDARLTNRINNVEDDANGGTASALAAANLPQPHDPGASMVSAAMGYYEGEGAFAVGVSTISDNGRWILKGSATVNTRSNAGVGVGVGYQW